MVLSLACLPMGLGTHSLGKESAENLVALLFCSGSADAAVRSGQFLVPFSKRHSQTGDSGEEFGQSVLLAQVHQSLSEVSGNPFAADCIALYTAQHLKLFIYTYYRVFFKLPTLFFGTLELLSRFSCHFVQIF